MRVTANEDYENQYPARSLAKITLRLRNGKTHSLEADRTEVRRYLTPTDADIEEKFRMIATPVLGEKKTGTVVGLTLGLERVQDLSELMQALQPGS